MKLFFLTCLLAATCTLPVLAQIDILQNRIAGKQKVAEIMAIVDAYYAEIERGERALTDEPKYKHWARWAYWASLHTDKEGNIVKGGDHINAALKGLNRDQQGTRTSTGSWISIGPKTITSSVGTAVGIGRVDRIAFHPSNANKFYLCTPSGGLLRTTNGGASYTHLTDYFPTSSVSALVVSHANNNILYALTGDGDGGGFLTSAGYRQYGTGVYVSYDEGASWAVTSPLPVTGDYVGYALAQDPNNANILMAATDQGIFRTTDAGVTWTQVLTERTYELKYQPNSSTIAYATQSGKFFRTINGGASWTQITAFDVPLNSGRIALAVTNASTSRVYLFSGWCITDTVCDDAGTFGGVYVSLNSGANFIQRATTPNIVTGCCDGENGRTQASYDLAIGVSHSNVNNLVTGALRVWRSTDGGVNMINADPGCSGESGFVHVDVHDVEYNPLNGYVYACTDGGLSVSMNNGEDWTDLSTGIANSQIYHMAGSQINTGQVVIGLQDNGMKSYSSGTTWSHMVGGDGFDAIYDHNQSSSGYVTSNSQLYRFTSNGTNVSNITPPSGASFFPRVEVHRTNPSIVFVGYSTMQKSTNGGSTWTSLGISGNWDIASCETNVNRFYAAGSTSAFGTTGSIYRTDDEGANWTDLTGNLGYPTASIRLTDIEVRPTNSNHVWITFGGYAEGDKVFYSFNGGNSWVNMSNGLPNVPVNAIQVDASNNAYAATDIGVYYRPNGASWIPFWHNLPLVPVTDLELYESTGIIRAATYGRGVWQSGDYSTCSTNLIFAFNVFGRKIYEASNNISAFSAVVGGANTDVTMKAGHEILLSTGFEALKGNAFRAYISSCGVYD